MPWKGVRHRFTAFHSNLFLTSDELDEGERHYLGVVKALNKHYYSLDSDSDNSLLVGSWGKHIKIRPIGDIDLYFVLPVETYFRFEKRSGNKQSQLLQEVKGVIEERYSSTKVKGDGPVVLTGFNRMSVEVVPCFGLANGQFRICSTKDGGAYLNADPVAEIKQVADVHTYCSNNLRSMIMMIKAWRINCNVQLKSFYLELLMTEFLYTYQYRSMDYFYFDWFFRDFFTFLISKANSSVYVPGTSEAISIGDAWLPKAKAASQHANNACANEYDDLVVSAGLDWEKIFGSRIK